MSTTKAQLFGSTVPRIWTKPLRELTEETTHGFEVIEFAERILKISLYPWQKWLLIHALELLPDGQYRFRRVTVLVARQNGKSTLMVVLAAWWLFVDSVRHKDRVPPPRFKIVGVAQNLDIAAEVWGAVRTWANPRPETEEEALLAIPALQAATAKVRDANDGREITARSRAHYEIRAAKNARGKPAARVIFDELREQEDWSAWSAISQTMKNFWGHQMWGISNAGDLKSVVLKKQREVCLALIKAWEDYVEAGVMKAEEFANSHDTSLGLFEWSAPEDCDLSDIDGILAANPSIGYGDITVESCLSDAATMPETEYRTEVLCQWVDLKADTYFEISQWNKLADNQSEIDYFSELHIGVDVSHDRQYTTIGVAGWRQDQLIHQEIITSREGMFWAIDYLKTLHANQPFEYVVIQGRGAPASELAPLLRKENLPLRVIEGSALGAATGQQKDRIRDRQIRHLGQPILGVSVGGAVTKKLGENHVYDRHASPTDSAPVAAVSFATWSLVTPPEDDEKQESAYSTMVSDWWRHTDDDQSSDDDDTPWWR